jgi:putative intracellular protease/amidase
MAKVVFIIANNGFQDKEFWIPYKILSAQWHQCDVASWKWGYCIGVFWLEQQNSLKLDELKVETYDLLIFVWGWWAERQYYHDETYLNLAKQAKAVAAICIAPCILSESWIFEWKEVTWWDDWEKTQITQIEKSWAIFKYEDVVQDWKFITANGPESATKFARKIVDFLK